VVEIHLDTARLIVRAIEQRATELNLNVAISVVDSGGNLLIFERMDGTQLASTTIAIGKAYTALAWQRPSGDLWPIAQPGQGGYGINTIDQRFVLSAGGLPIQIDGQTMAGVGVSGGTSEQDRDCAEAGLAAMEQAQTR